MTDYELTAGQQSQLVSFLNAGKAIYIDGNDFGYFHSTTTLYSMFGCTYLGDSDVVVSMTGEDDTFMESASFSYQASGYADDYMDWIGSNGGDLSLKSEEGKWRLVSYAGPDGTYRAIHAAFWLTALKDGQSNYTKAELMAAFMRYLKGDSLVLGLKGSVPASTGGHVDMFLENPVSEAGREYIMLGSVSGTNPGLPLGSVILPLNYDMFMGIVINNLNGPIFVNFLGNLDAQGRAMATLNTLGPVDPACAGISIYFAYALMAPYDFASNPVEVYIE